MVGKLWFDVEKRYLTTIAARRCRWRQLWFDVEKRYLTTRKSFVSTQNWLWFDVEKGYFTTSQYDECQKVGCGFED